MLCCKNGLNCWKHLYQKAYAICGWKSKNCKMALVTVQRSPSPSNSPEAQLGSVSTIHSHTDWLSQWLTVCCSTVWLWALGLRVSDTEWLTETGYGRPYPPPTSSQFIGRVSYIHVWEWLWIRNRTRWSLGYWYGRRSRGSFRIPNTKWLWIRKAVTW